MSDEKVLKEITFEELKEHGSREKLYILLHNKVYNVSQFIDEHPGGDEVMLAEAGKDATEAFEDVGHSDEAREILAGLLIGDFEKDGVLKTKDVPNKTPSAQFNEPPQSGAMSYIIPLAFLGAYFAWRYYSS